MKLIGSLYEERKECNERPETPPPEPAEDLFRIRVLEEDQRSAKKARCSSSKADQARRAVRKTLNEVVDLKNEVTDTIKSLNTTARLKYLESIGGKASFDLPLELLEEEQNEEAMKRFAELQ